MKALIKAKNEPGIWMDDVPIPSISSNDVLVKINKTAICGTDLHIYNWDDWAQQNINVPLVIGHEFVGEIVECGKDVPKHFQVGNRISGEGHIACHYCRNCRAGRSHLCRTNVSVGVTRNGCFAEYLAIPAHNAYHVPDHISDSEAAILDPFGNAAHTTFSFPLAGEDVLITGAGPVGVMCAAIARHLGARYVVITDVNAYRLDLAKKMGVTLAIDPTTTSLDSVMKELDMKEGFDVGLEVSGNAQAFKDMITHMNHAGKIALLGFLPQNTDINWTQVIMKGLVIKGIYGREMFDTWHKMIMLLQSGLKISHVITHEYSIDDFNLAFNTMKTGQSGKVIMNWR